jgi:hypothetical protein
LELVRIDFSFLNYDVLILNQLGRLGLGLVIPLLRHYAAGVPLAIFQRPRADNELMGETISLNINDDTVMEFKCVTRHTAHVDIHSLLEQKAPLFVSTSNVEILQAVLSHTTSFSTSVGPCGFDDTIQGLEIARRTQYTRNNGIPRKVYLFENDAERFKKLIEERFGHEHFDIVHVMCDRICTQRHWKEDEVQVVCERYPGMAVVFPSKRDDITPFRRVSHEPSSPRRSSLPKLILTRTKDEAQFYYQRKLSLLNGTHFTMAVLAYNALQRAGHPRESWPSHMLCEWKNDTRNHRLVNLTIQGRILRLMFETPAKVLVAVHGTENKSVIYSMIMDYVSTTLKRIESTADTVGRVLNLKDEKNLRIKHERYLTNNVNWLNKCKLGKLGYDITGSKIEEIVSSFEILTDKLALLEEL